MPSRDSIAPSRSFIWNGLAMDLSAGASFAQSRVGSTWAMAVSRMTGILDVFGFSLISRQASKPLFLGIMPSRMMMSGVVERAWSTPSSPSSASTSSKPWFWSMKRRMPRVLDESSAIRTRLFIVSPRCSSRSPLHYTSWEEHIQYGSPGSGRNHQAGHAGRDHAAVEAPEDVAHEVEGLLRFEVRGVSIGLPLQVGSAVEVPDVVRDGVGGVEPA